MKIAILPGDGIGTEIVAQAERVLGALDLRVETEHALVGGAAYEAHGHPLPEATLALAKAAPPTRAGSVSKRRSSAPRTRSAWATISVPMPSPARIAIFMSGSCLQRMVVASHGCFSSRSASKARIASAWRNVRAMSS